jgi:hypothetical protein
LGDIGGKAQGEKSNSESGNDNHPGQLAVKAFGPIDGVDKRDDPKSGKKVSE